MTFLEVETAANSSLQMIFQKLKLSSSTPPQLQTLQFLWWSALSLNEESFLDEKDDSD